VNPSLLQRQAALAGVALLAALGAIALGRDSGPAEAPAAETEVAPAAEWRAAEVGISRRARGCGRRVEGSELGVVHPVLPCGAQLEVERRGMEVRTEVVGRGPVGLEHEFNLTRALAERLGLAEPGAVRWRFAS
jgi:hypothetical protein